MVEMMVEVMCMQPDSGDRRQRRAHGRWHDRQTRLQRGGSETGRLVEQQGLSFAADLRFASAGPACLALCPGSSPTSATLGAVSNLRTRPVMWPTGQSLASSQAHMLLLDHSESSRALCSGRPLVPSVKLPLCMAACCGWSLRQAHPHVHPGPQAGRCPRPGSPLLPECRRRKADVSLVWH